MHCTASSFSQPTTTSSATPFKSACAQRIVRNLLFHISYIIIFRFSNSCNDCVLRFIENYRGRKARFRLRARQIHIKQHEIHSVTLYKLRFVRLFVFCCVLYCFYAINTARLSNGVHLSQLVNNAQSCNVRIMRIPERV